MTIGNVRGTRPEDRGKTAIEGQRTGSRKLSRNRVFVERACLPAAYAVLCAAALSPLLWASIPPPGDYPNHLARMAVLGNVGPSALHANYVADWRLLPNLAMDLFVPWLAQIVPLEIAGRLFLGATLILLVAGTAALHRVLHGRVGYWPLCSILFLYNIVFWFGFLNYLFGLGAALLGFAGWIATANWRRAARVAAFAGIASAIFLLHLFAFGVYGLLVGSYELDAVLHRRNNAVDAFAGLASRLVQFVPAAFLWVLCVGNGGPQYLSYGTLPEKLTAIFAPFSFSIPPTAFDVSLLGATLAFCYVASRKQLFDFAPEMRLPLAAILLATAMMPAWISGSWGADLRLPVVLPFIILASTRPRQWPRLAIVLCSTSVLVFFLIRIWSVSQAWYDMDQRFREFRTALATVPIGARLFAVQSKMPNKEKRFPGVPEIIKTRSSGAFGNMDSLAVIDRGAFITSLYFDWYPIRPAARNAGLARIIGSFLSPGELAVLAHPTAAEVDRFPRNVLGELPCCIDWPNKYDFVVWVDFGHPPNRLPEHLRKWAGGSFFHIYRIIPGSGALALPDRAPD